MRILRLFRIAYHGTIAAVLWAVLMLTDLPATLGLINAQHTNGALVFVVLCLLSYFGTSIGYGLLAKPIARAAAREGGLSRITDVAIACVATPLGGFLFSIFIANETIFARIAFLPFALLAMLPAQAVRYVFFRRFGEQIAEEMREEEIVAKAKGPYPWISCLASGVILPIAVFGMVAGVMVATGNPISKGAAMFPVGAVFALLLTQFFFGPFYHWLGRMMLIAWHQKDRGRLGYGVNYTVGLIVAFTLLGVAFSPDVSQIGQGRALWSTVVAFLLCSACAAVAGAVWAVFYPDPRKREREQVVEAFA